MADTSLRDGLREVRDQARPSAINPKLEEAVQNQPLLPHLLSFDVVFKAVAIGAVVALLMFVIASPMMAGVGLLISFFAAWIGLATYAYGKASERAEAARSSDDDDES